MGKEERYMWVAATRAAMLSMYLTSYGASLSVIGRWRAA